jgi:hypothetical protein
MVTPRANGADTSPLAPVDVLDLFDLDLDACHVRPPRKASDLPLGRRIRRGG